MLVFENWSQSWEPVYFVLKFWLTFIYATILYKGQDVDGRIPIGKMQYKI